jgi:hypothetical protein
MKTWLQKFAFKWVNLYRYSAFLRKLADKMGMLPANRFKVGLYNLNPVDPRA